MAKGEDDEFRPGAHAGGGKDRAQIVLDDLMADAQLSRDVLIGHAVADHGQDLSLSRCQAFQDQAAGRGHMARFYSAMSRASAASLGNGGSRYGAAT